MGVLALIVKSRAVAWTALRWLMFLGELFYDDFA